MWIKPVFLDSCARMLIPVHLSYGSIYEMRQKRLPYMAMIYDVIEAEILPVLVFASKDLEGNSYGYPSVQKCRGGVGR